MQYLKEDIIKAIETKGGTVIEVSRLRRGMPSLLVGFRGTNSLLFIKDGTQSAQRRHMTDAELNFQTFWRGRVRIANSVAEALNLVGATNE